MENCPTIDPQIGTAQTLIQSVNCYVETSVANSYGALMGPGGGLKGALTAALVIYVAVLGIASCWVAPVCRWATWCRECC